MAKKDKKEKICAVVVTYNRKELLAECLDAVLAQSHPLDSIILIDNASTDGTSGFLKEKGYLGNKKIDYIRLKENTGGAGGFYEGVKRGYEKGYDWLWLMDDDTIPYNNALSELLKVKNIVPIEKIGFVGSKVLWIDKTPHLMNVPRTEPLVNGIPFNRYEENGFLIVETISFVSLLIRRSVIEKVGYPIKEFFIWADDVEFTKRISNYFIGFYCNRSVVIHKSKENYSARNTYDWRLYYHIRNNLYLERKNNKIHFFIYFLLKNFLKTFSLPLKCWKISIKACFASLFFNPKIVYPYTKKQKR